MQGKLPLRILLTCDPEIPVPPIKYGGIERIVNILLNGLIARGHTVTLCANAASNVSCNLLAWRGRRSQHLPDIIRNIATLTSAVIKNKFDVIHSFSRLAYMGLIMPSTIPKVMSYQREPSVSQVKKAIWLSSRNSLYFTGCSDYITNQIKPFANARTIYNAVQVEIYNFRQEVKSNAPLVFLGRIEEIKGAYEAVLVAQKSNRDLVIAGNIPHGKEDYFLQKIQPHLNDRIQYVGPVDDKQKNFLLGNSAALLMPILWDEPFGIVMAEAMACGTPVIGLARGAVPEVIDNGITGFVCNSFEEMVTAVHNMNQLDRLNVRRAAEKEFSSGVLVDNYLELYRELLQG